MRGGEHRRRLSSDISSQEIDLLERKTQKEMELDALKVRRSFELRRSWVSQALEEERAGRGHCRLRNCGYMCCGSDTI